MKIALSVSVIVLAAIHPASAQSLDTTVINAQFASYASSTTPGCALAIARDGRTIFERAWGMADLERDVHNTVGTIFEAGSVTKQFTAAAVLILAQRGKLSLDDNIRKWFPELADFGEPITVRHLLQHTSGLRDWGVLASIEGWPRGTRTSSQGDVLNIMSRQRTLNHPVGAQFSYTNTGYNLAVMLVERASGESFPIFTKRELFDPIGMTHTQWRDDYARLVKGRAQAYGPSGIEWKLSMPFENAYGNGGLLTTVGDLLKWNDALTARHVGNPDVSAQMETPGQLKDGKPIQYGFGLFVRDVRGVREIGHDGSTAGYSTFLARYPNEKVSVAVLCNAADASGTNLARVSVRSLMSLTAAAPAATPAPAPPPAPTLSTAQLSAFVGTWRSEEMATALDIRLNNGTLTLTRRPGLDNVMRPLGGAPDRFQGGSAEVRFERDAQGRVVRMLVSIPRALNVPYVRVQ